MRQITIAIATAVAGLAGLTGFAGPMSQAAAAQEAERRTLSVTGQGDHQAAPDMAMIRIGVTTEAREAKRALDENSARMAGTIAALEGQGLEKRDLQTSNLSLQPIWSQRQSSPGKAPEITGFRAHNSLSIRVRDLARLGAVLDATVGAGANQFNGLNFMLSNPVPAADAARAAAVADALRKAQVLAEAAGVALGPILSISEHGGAPRAVRMDMARAEMQSAVPVQAGELSVTASVSLVFALN